MRRTTARADPRREAPVHYLADSANGPFWSVTSHGLIKAVDTNHTVRSSEAGGITFTNPEEVNTGALRAERFIQLGPPRACWLPCSPFRTKNAACPTTSFG